MGELIVLLVLAAVVLSYASVLIFVRLRSAGAPPGRARWAVIELWITFLVIAGAFALIRSLVGVPQAGSAYEELTRQFARVRALPGATQAVVYGAFLFAFVLFIHMIWSLQRLNQQYPTPQGEHHE